MMVSQGLNALFTPGGPKFLFEVVLSKLLQVTGPWAKGLRVLEAADVTADHLYYVFLGIMSQHQEDFQKNEYRLNLSTLEGIRCIANSRFNELVNETPQSHDLYISQLSSAIPVRSLIAWPASYLLINFGIKTIEMHQYTRISTH